MRIHSDRLEFFDFGLAAGNAGLGPDVYYERTAHGSRSRARAFEFQMNAEPGSDKHGIKRSFATNSGVGGGAPSDYKAATWVEWGDLITELFKIDPQAIIGPYDGSEDFVRQTLKSATNRPAREDAESHAARWARELGHKSLTVRMAGVA